MEYFSATLANGIRLVHCFVDSPVAHCGVIINVGSRDEEPQYQGIAHFIEHTIFKGTKKRKAYHILSRMEDVGGEMNAYTSKEDTAIHASFLCEYYERALELFGDILTNSTFPERELKKEKEVIIDEINSYNDTPSELIFDEFEEMIFANHSIGRNILGTPDIVRGFIANDLHQFIALNYTTDQMVITSVGRILPKKLLKLAERYFSNFPANKRENFRQKFSDYKTVTRLIDKDTYQAHCIIGCEAMSAFDNDRIAFVLLNNILGGQSSNSRLNLALRERNGIAYNIESSYSAYSDTGTFTIYFGTDKENLDRAISLINKEINVLQTKKLGALQLAKAKKQLVSQLAMSQENHEDMMLAIGKSYLTYNKIDDLDIIYQKINSISDIKLMEIANNVLNFNKLSTIIYQ